MPAPVIERIERACNPVDRMSRTEAARGNWVERLESSGVIEVLDRNQTCGYLVSKETLWEIGETISQMKERVSDLEEALEQAEIARLVSERGDHERQVWKGRLSEEEASRIVRDVMEKRGLL